MVRNEILKGLTIFQNINLRLETGVLRQSRSLAYAPICGAVIIFGSQISVGAEFGIDWIIFNDMLTTLVLFTVDCYKFFLFGVA